MKLTRKSIIAIALAISCILLHLLCNNKFWVEHYYSNGFFVWFSKILRISLGSIPFSIGDILYGLAFLWLVWMFFKWVRNIIKKKGSGKTIKSRIVSFFIFCTIVYLVFNIFWGVNYNRKGIAFQMQLDIKKYDSADLKTLNGILLDKINSTKQVVEQNKISYSDNDKLFSIAIDAYKNAAVLHPFLKYENPSIKSSQWGWLGNYLGFTGYYNPFTGEAQVNTTVPKTLLPFVCCHEIAHQIGYAKEREANFVGFLVANASNDTLLKYSAYLDLFLYANRNLYLYDSTSAKLYRDQLSPLVKKDIIELVKFNKSHQNIIEPVITKLYNFFLINNQQPQGMMSYDEVTGFIIAYYKKYGSI